MPQETKPTITVGIPAYNEANNLPKLLNQLLAQQGDNYILDRIIVISDGSTDNTVDEVKKIVSSKIHLIDHKDKKGKAERFAEIMRISDSDILVQLDADIALSSSAFLKDITNEYTKTHFDLLCIDDAPLNPRTYVERSVHLGNLIWKDILKHSKNIGYYHHCAGRARAFSRKYYFSFVLPKEADVVEDKFSYLYAVQGKYKISKLENSYIQYRLPSNVRNYIKQMGRFRRADSVLSRYFDKKLIEKESFIEPHLKFKAILRSFFMVRPDYLIGYLLIHITARFLSNSNHERAGYEYLSSTKSL